MTSVHPYLARQVGFTLDGEQTLLYVVGFDPVTGPAHLDSGSQQVGDEGIIVDTVFAAGHGVNVGDVLTLNGVDLTVTGISNGDMVMCQYAYVDAATAPGACCKNPGTPRSAGAESGSAIATAETYT